MLVLSLIYVATFICVFLACYLLCAIVRFIFRKISSDKTEIETNIISRFNLIVVFISIIIYTLSYQYIMNKVWL